MATHSDEPHVHTLTFIDNDGQSYSLDIDCPAGTMKDFGDALEATGADSVNGLAVDGKLMSFEGVFTRLGAAGKLPMLGHDYQTPENLLKVMVAMGSADEPA